MTNNRVVLTGVQGMTIMAILADRIADADTVLDEFAGKTADATAARDKAERERDEAQKALAADSAAGEELAAERRRDREDVLSRLAVAEQERDEAKRSALTAAQLTASISKAANAEHEAHRIERNRLQEELSRAVDERDEIKADFKSRSVNYAKLMTEAAVMENERNLAETALAAAVQIAANLREERRVLAEAVAYAVRSVMMDSACAFLKRCGEPEETCRSVRNAVDSAASPADAAPLIEGCLQHRKREA